MPISDLLTPFQEWLVVATPPFVVLTIFLMIVFALTFVVLKFVGAALSGEGA